jgi:probable HAF family extracellular repeat protein
MVNGSVTSRAFLISDGVFTELPTLGGVSAGGGLITNGRMVVGQSDANADGTAQHAFIWRDGMLTDMGTLGGARSLAWAANERGQVVGYAETGPGVEHAFLWDNGQLVDLGTLGGPASQALAINGVGQIVGWADTAEQNPARSAADQLSYIRHAVAWRDGQIIDLGTLGGRHSEATSINDNGDIVGWSNLPGDPRDDCADFIRRAVLWRDATFSQLGTTPGFESSFAVRINNVGIVLARAESRCRNPSRDAFVWENGTLTRLEPPMGSTYVSVGRTSINADGCIVAAALGGSSLGTANRYKEGQICEFLGLVDGGDTIDGLAGAIVVGDGGHVVSSAFFHGGIRGFLFSPRGAACPECSTVDRPSADGTNMDLSGANGNAAGRRPVGPGRSGCGVGMCLHVATLWLFLVAARVKRPR